jgi:hypothetical protein
MPEELPLKNPSVIWAQRLGLIYLTVEVEDMKVDELNCKANHFVLKGSNAAGRYDVELELYADVLWEEHKQVLFICLI